jgi:hypothetical protein
VKSILYVFYKKEAPTNAGVEAADGSMIDLKNARAAFDVFESCA